MASGKKRTRRSGSSARRANRSTGAATQRNTPKPDADVTSAPAATPAATSAATPAAPIAAASTGASTSASATSSSETDVPIRRRDNVDWNNEYSYVIGDLKQLVVVSVGLFAIMIAIGYFL